MILSLIWAIMTIIPLCIKTGRLFVDYTDRMVYYERGKWFTENTPPISEYPQIPTLLFGINHSVIMWLNTDIQPIVYLAFFSLEMMLVLFIMFKILLELLPPEHSNYAFLVLLPPTIYFAYNRFDILPALLCLIAYRASTKKQWILVSFLLAIATFTKWYPVLLFPGFLIYATMVESKFQWKMIATFAISSLTILIISFLHGGLESIQAPYILHISRSMEYVALPVLIDKFLKYAFEININLTYYFLFFFILQISAPIIIVIYFKINSLDLLIHYCIITIAMFILFSRIWSPQWFLWLLPFLILSANNIKVAVLIIVYNIVTYLCFPVFFDFYGDSSVQLQISGLLTYIILFIIIIWSTKSLLSSKGLVSLKQGILQ